MPKYIDSKTLATLVRKAKKSKSLSPELCKVIRQIMIGLIDRNKFNLWNSDKEDCVQDAIVLVSRKIGNMKPKANCFSYLTTVCFNLLRQKYRTELLMFKTLEGLRQAKKISTRDKLVDRWNVDQDVSW